MIIDEKPGKNNNSDWWANRSRILIEDQKKTWPLLRENYLALADIKTKDFDFGHFKITAQYNPARIKSSGADVSESAINSRKCFLCLGNLPDEQSGLKYDKNFVILSNPYPIFEEHFTIVNKKHTDQTLIGHFDDLLNLSRDLGKSYSLFYNGPKCGASAPDHMHFQAGIKKITPVEYEIDSFKKIAGIFVLKNSKIQIHFFEKVLRNFFVMESSSKGELLYAFKIFVKAARKISALNEEPKMNLISSFENGCWRVFVFPRSKHRPDQFYKTGNDALLISPAAIDMGGVLIMPDKNDFEKLTKEIIADVYKQVSISKEYFEYLKKKLGEVF